jgi:phage N-6-adenine-methyltransferase
MNKDWETPQTFFDAINAEFGFVLDVAASDYNAKCERFLTAEQDSLQCEWGSPCWMNPPYGRGTDVYSWVHKAYRLSQDGGTAVCLLPASTDTKWFHDFAMRSSEVRFIRDRLWFGRNGNSARANHANILVVFRPYCSGPPKIKSINKLGAAL